MRQRLIIAAAWAVAVAAIGVGVAGASHDRYPDPSQPSDGGSRLSQSAYMSGGEIVDEDGVGDSDGKGSATFLQIDRETVCYGFAVTKTGTPTAIGIYKGAAGKTGPLVLGFANVPKDADGAPAGDPGWSSGCREAENQAEVAAMRRIRKAPENYYLLMKTEDFAGGAIRGQLAGAR
jgi:hypothetical protein